MSNIITLVGTNRNQKKPKLKEHSGLEVCDISSWVRGLWQKKDSGSNICFIYNYVLNLYNVHSFTYNNSSHLSPYLIFLSPVKSKVP